ncbi:MAG TPA: type IV secretion system DNA-binding domain-containing protein [Candidatus Paceibacterota bacterium]|nr:type IV secretion system DNA-binding domain-containing protein [Candidatus Paceibacterota bacterium]
MEHLNTEDKVTYFAQTDARDKKIPFGIKSKDRSRHTYIIGKTGMGKSTVLENMAVQDIQNGNGLAFIDPHGKTADLLLQYVPEHRIKDVLYFAPFDIEHPISFNVMEDVGADKRHLVVSGLMSAFKKIWVDAWSARMEYILNNILLALLEYPDSTLIGVNRMLADKEYRKKVVDNITDPSVKAFWVDEFAKYGERYMQEAGAAIQNKIGQFISNPLVRNIIGQPKSTFDIRKMMDEKKILIINLSKGRVGEQNANLLGSMLITKIYLGAMSRADASDAALKKLPNFYLYVDEFQSFANESFADILSEARKYKLNLTIAHQYIEQMSDEVRAAVFGNVGTMIVFRVGAFDAEVLEKEFAPTFTAEDIVNLGIYQIYLKLMIDGVSSQPFSATTLPPIQLPSVSQYEKIIEQSRLTYASKRAGVEEEVRKQAGVDKESHPPQQRVEKRQEAFPRREHGSEPQRDTRRQDGGSFNRDTRPSRPLDTQPQRNPHNPPADFAQKRTEPRTAPPAFDKPVLQTQDNDDFVPLTKTVSLTELKPKPPITSGLEHNTKKVPSQKNVNDLRQALASVVPKVEKTDTSAISATSEKNIPKPQPKEQIPTPPPSSKQEVPEDVLKKILDMNQ